jgi:hypothetical protein
MCTAVSAKPDQAIEQDNKSRARVHDRPTVSGAISGRR